MYEAYEYTNHGSYELVAQGDELTIGAYVNQLASELGYTVTKNEGRFEEFGVWWYDLRPCNGTVSVVIVVDELC